VQVESGGQIRQVLGVQVHRVDGGGLDAGQCAFQGGTGAVLGVQQFGTQYGLRQVKSRLGQQLGGVLEDREHAPVQRDGGAVEGGHRCGEIALEGHFGGVVPALEFLAFGADVGFGGAAAGSVS